MEEASLQRWEWEKHTEGNGQEIKGPVRSGWLPVGGFQEITLYSYNKSPFKLN